MELVDNWFWRVGTITPQEWLAGFSATLDIGLLLVLGTYMIKNWTSRFQLHYCIAIGIFICVVGYLWRQLWIWNELLHYNYYLTQAELAEKYPIVGSAAWLIGTVITAIGLVKLMFSFSESYMRHKQWIIIVTVAALMPFILEIVWGLLGL